MVSPSRVIAPLIDVALFAGLPSALKHSSSSHNVHLPPGPGEQLPDDAGTDNMHLALSDSMKHALQTLQAIDKLPSCPKMAAAALIHSCSSLEGTIADTKRDAPRGVDHFLDDEKNIYAARLAVCELTSAKGSVPLACQPFVPTLRTPRKRTLRSWFVNDGYTRSTETYPEYEEITQQHLDRCLLALQSTPQAWTSFSNNRQNAFVMCQAMSIELENDLRIDLFKDLAATTSDIEDSLSHSQKEWEKLKVDFRDLRTGLRQFYSELVQNDKKRSDGAERIWAEWELRTKNGLGELSQEFRKAQEEVDLTKTAIVDGKASVGAAFQDTKLKLADLATQQHELVVGLTEKHVSLSDMMVYSYEMFKQGIAKGIYDATKNVELVNKVSVTIHKRLEEYDDAFSVAARKVKGLESQVDVLAQNLEQLQTENHRMARELQIEANRTREALGEVKQYANQLTAAVESAAQLLAGQWPGAFRVVEKLGTFVGYLAIYGLLGVGFWQKLLNFGVLASATASLASGLVLAFISTSYVGPTDVTRYLLDTTLPSGMWVYGVVSGLIVLLASLRRLYYVSR